MRTNGRRLTLSMVLGAVLMSWTGCVDERVIYRDRPIFLEPDPAALDFVGYANPDRPESKLTVCGQCHVGQQSQWERTAHAFTWDKMQATGAAQQLCEACHSVNSLGNVAGGSGQAVGGWVAVNDARYHDVQCESCHGPGLQHVRNPSIQAAQPQAPITVGTDLTFGCGQCHTGFHQPFVEEWSVSAHGNVTSYAAVRQDDAGGCWSCHSGEGALRKFGVRSNYLEKEALVDRNEGFAHITCAVCHDPHSNEFEGQLRFPSNTANIETHICAQCHNRATVPGVGPRGLAVHAPEAPLIDGALHSVGWVPPGTVHDFDRIQGSHGGESNPRLCSTCHVVPYTVQDQATGRTFASSGHTFRPIPCVDANGLPTADQNCPLTVAARDWRGCTDGCHGSATAAASVTNSALTLNLSLVRDLYRMLRQIDPNLAGPGGPIDPTNPQFTVAEGAYFNLQLTHHGTPLHQNNFNISRADSLAALAPSTVHNPFLIRSLLVWSIEAVRNEYGVSPSPAFDPASLLADIPLR
jgi:predicted CXXCH cytochrome family protein